MPFLHRSFSAKEPYNLWLFCKKWTWGILWVYATLYPVRAPMGKTFAFFREAMMSLECAVLIAYTHARTHTHTWALGDRFRFLAETHTHTHARMHKHTHTHTHACTHTHTNTHTHTHTYTPKGVERWWWWALSARFQFLVGFAVLPLDQELPRPGNAVRCVVSVLQCVVVCCSMLQSVAVCCSVLQRITVLPADW